MANCNNENHSHIGHNHWEGVCPVCGNKLHAMDENYKLLTNDRMWDRVGSPVKCGRCWSNLIVNEDFELEVDPDNLWDKMDVAQGGSLWDQMLIYTER